MLLTNFKLERRIGRGGMGEVWLGAHRRRQVPVAVKFARPQRWTGEERAAFRHEAAVMARMHHRHIVRIHDFGETHDDIVEATDGAIIAGSPFVVMEFCRGVLRRSKAPAPLPVVGKMVTEVLSALAHAHARGVIHRDLKPSNILVARRDGGRVVKLADFGLAQVVDPRDLRDGRQERPAGTPPYMAPEQCQGLWRDFGPWTDLYALGCIVHELLAGTPPFQGSSFAELAAAHCAGPRPVFEASLGVPGPIASWVDRCLRIDPRERFQTAAEASKAWRTATPDVAVRAPALELSDTDAVETLFADTVVGPAQTFEESPLPKLGRARDVGVVSAVQIPADWRSQIESDDDELPDTGLGLIGLRDVPPVGRVRERDVLWNALQAMGEGASTVVLIRGGVGAGKTHLARWFCERAEEVGAASSVSVVHHREAAVGSGLVEMLRRRMRLRGLNPDQTRARVRRLLADAPGPGPLWRRCAHLVAPRQGEEALLSTEGERHLLVAECLDHLAGQRGWIAHLDDAHWAPSCFSFAQRVLERRGRACMVVMTLPLDSVDDEVEEAVGRLMEAGAISIELGAIDDQDMHEIVGKMLGVSNDLRARVVSTAAGNPLAAAQTLANWVRSGRVTGGTDGHRLREGAASSSLTDLLAGLSPGQDLALTALAALGAEVEGATWTAVCRELGVEIDPELEERVLRWGIVSATVTGWRFTHKSRLDEVRELGDSLGLTARCHGACAKVLPVDTPEAKLRVARHHIGLGAPDEALRLMALAARSYQAQGSELEVDAVLTRRAKLLDGPELDADVAELQVSVHRNRGEVEAAESWLHRARQLDPNRLELDLAAVRVMRWRGRHAEAVAAAEQLVALADLRGEPELAAWALAEQGGALVRGGRSREAIGVFKRAMERADDCGALKALSLSLSGRVVARLNLGEDGPELDADIARGLEVATASAAMRPLAAKLVLAGEVERKRGNLARAAALYRDGYERFRRVELRDAAVVAGNLALTYMAQGRIEAAQEWLERGAPGVRGEVHQNWFELVRFCVTLAAGEDARPYWASRHKVEEDWDAAWMLETAGRRALDGVQHGLALAALDHAAGLWQVMGDVGRADALRALHDPEARTVPMRLDPSVLRREPDKS